MKLIVVDGNDGTGKTTLVAALSQLGWTVRDRGLPTQATDRGVPALIPPNEIYIILDVPETVSRQRLQEAGKDLQEYWHTPAALTHYRQRFLEVASVYRQVNSRFVLSDLIKNPPPIEVIVKAYHSGTSKHRYYGMSGYPIRSTHPFYSEYTFSPDGGYPAPLVRFDWRNPLYHPETDKILADEVLGDAQADWFIDTAKAKLTALKTYRALANFLQARDIVLYDLCLFITQDGETVFGEISQDCGRFRHFDLGCLDKDEWRAGGSSEQVLKKWQLLLDLIAGDRSLSFTSKNLKSCQV